tara:strand:+ start:2212 stop:3213 length:1002 start_codon:yes stop_codon:yes gene_type:complete
MNRAIILFLFILFSIIVHCQQPLYSFGILNFNNSARTASLGGYSIAVIDDDPTTSLLLPSNISRSNSGKIILNYVNHFADTDYAFLNYTYSFENIGVFSTSLVYCNYGKFDYSDPDGIFSGAQFFVYDIMGQVGYSKKLFDNFQIGINLKYVHSLYENYSASAIGFDASATYFNSKNSFGSSILIQNIGRSLTTFQPTSNKENLPFNIQLSINKKLSHSPIRFHFIYHDFQKWNINSIEKENKEFNFQSFSSNFTNHIVLASEFLFSESFNVRLGYNFKNRKELQPNSRAGGIGFSWGVGFKVKKLNISYSYSRYHFSGTSNNLTVVKSIKNN